MELKEMSLLELGAKLNEISYEIDRLTIQYNMIVDEIKERIPNLQDDPNLTQKVMVKNKM